jgi:hypothetical protein
MVFTYALSFGFESHGLAQGIMVFFYFITGTLFNTAAFLLFMFEKTRKYIKVIKWVLKLWPPFIF